MTTSPTAQERTQEAASTAADQGKHVAGTAKDEAHNVASEAVSQARNVAHGVLTDVSSQVSEQSRSQQDRLGSTLRSLGDDLEKMSAQADSGLAGDLAREAAQRARAMSQHLEGREPADLLDDVRRFARQRPGTFLLGALGAGVVAGRLLRGAKDGIEGAKAAGPSTPTLTSSTNGTTGTTGTTGGTSTGGPIGTTTRTPAVGTQGTPATGTPAVGTQGTPATGTPAVGTQATPAPAPLPGASSGLSADPTLEDDRLGGDRR